jgi:hypothetical protein
MWGFLKTEKILCCEKKEPFSVGISKKVFLKRGFHFFEKGLPNRGIKKSAPLAVGNPLNPKQVVCFRGGVGYAFAIYRHMYLCIN